MLRRDAKSPGFFFVESGEVSAFLFPAVYYPSVSQGLWGESYCWLLGQYDYLKAEEKKCEQVKDDCCLSTPNPIEA